MVEQDRDMIIREQYRTLKTIQRLIRSLFSREITGFSVWRHDHGYDIQTHTRRIRWHE